MNDNLENAKDDARDADPNTTAEWIDMRNDLQEDLRGLQENIINKLNEVNEDLAKTDLSAEARAEKTALKTELENEKQIVSDELERVTGATEATWDDVRIGAEKTANDVEAWWNGLKENVDQKTDMDKDNDGQ